MRQRTITQLRRWMEEYGAWLLPLCPGPTVYHQRLVQRYPYHRGCSAPGKIPWYRWKAYQQQALSWAEFQHLIRGLPLFNVGLLLGTPLYPVVGIDIDDPISYAWLHERHPEGYFHTPSFHTARGIRYLYHCEPVRPSAVYTPEPGVRIELLGKNRYTVIPPSVHATGVPYRWLRPPRLCWYTEKPARAFAPLPAFLFLERQDSFSWRGESASAWEPTSLPASPSGEIPPPSRVFPSSTTRLYLPGERNRQLFSIARALLYRQVQPTLVYQCLVQINQQQCSPPLEMREVHQLFQQACRYNRNR
jgi:hypothetical protein